MTSTNFIELLHIGPHFILSSIIRRSPVFHTMSRYSVTSKSAGDLRCPTFPLFLNKVIQVMRKNSIGKSHTRFANNKKPLPSLRQVRMFGSTGPLLHQHFQVVRWEVRKARESWVTNARHFLHNLLKITRFHNIV